MTRNKSLNCKTRPALLRVFFALGIALMLLRTICLADDPCPIDQLPQGVQRVSATSITPAQIPKQIAEAARILVPSDYTISGAQRVQISSDLVASFACSA